MVNGKSMPSSASSSLLLSTGLPPLNAAAGAAGPLAAGQSAAGFADLLKGMPTQGGALPVSVGLPGRPAAVATENMRTAVDFQALNAAESAPVQAAGATKMAIAAGRILPVALPEAAETGRKPELAAKDAPAEAAEAQTEEPALAILDPVRASLGPAIAPAPSTIQAGQPPSANPLVDVAVPPTDRATKPLSAKTLSAIAGHRPGEPVTAELRPQATDGHAVDARAAAAVQISVAARSEAVPIDASSELAAGGQPKPVRAAGRASVGAPLPSHQTLSAPPSSVQSDFATPAQPVQVASASSQAPSPVDITAALDRLVAARDALMPAEAALAIDHADFGEVSIRFEQSSDGRLSAELSAADPELQRAVTAAVATDRDFSAGPEGDGGRSMAMASHGRSMAMASPRGSATGGEATSGERGQPGHDRDPDRRRMPGRPQGEPGSADPQAGVFA